jgi:hypothetical protein
MSAFNPDRNPFEYKRCTQKHYEGLVEVYRKADAMIATDNWVKLMKEGLFDPNHTIGE